MMPRHEKYRAQRHFSCLDGIRFLCIAAVIWHHAPGKAPYDTMPALFARGHVGVDFFFVLSGFLITTLLLRERAQNGQFSLRGFYWRRALRILPVYYLVVTAAAFNDVILNGEYDKLDILPFYYLFLANFISVSDITFLDPTWSLSVEEQYYLIWPLLLLVLPRRAVVPALMVLIAINVIAPMGGFDPFGIHGFSVGLLYFALGGATYSPILLGSLAAVALHRKAVFETVAPWLSARIMPWVLFGGLILALALLPARLEGWPNMVVHSLMTLIIMAVVVREDNGMARLLCLPPIVRVGQISYGVYLYHSFAIGITAPLLFGFGVTDVLTNLVAFVALTLVVSEISFRTYEKWFLDLRYRLKNRP